MAMIVRFEGFLQAHAPFTTLRSDPTTAQILKKARGENKVTPGPEFTPVTTTWVRDPNTGRLMKYPIVSSAALKAMLRYFATIISFAARPEGAPPITVTDWYSATMGGILSGGKEPDYNPGIHDLMSSVALFALFGGMLPDAYRGAVRMEYAIARNTVLPAAPTEDEIASKRKPNLNDGRPHGLQSIVHINSRTNSPKILEWIAPEERSRWNDFFNPTSKAQKDLATQISMVKDTIAGIKGKLKEAKARDRIILSADLKEQEDKLAALRSQKGVSVAQVNLRTYYTPPDIFDHRFLLEDIDDPRVLGLIIAALEAWARQPWLGAKRSSGYSRFDFHYQAYILNEETGRWEMKGFLKSNFQGEVDEEAKRKAAQGEKHGDFLSTDQDVFVVDGAPKEWLAAWKKKPIPWDLPEALRTEIEQRAAQARAEAAVEAEAEGETSASGEQGDE